MAKPITEILDEINETPSSIEKYRGNTALSIIFEYAFDPNKKFNLPDGDPPYVPDSAPMMMSPGNLYMELKRLYVFCRTDLTQLRIETLFIQLLENIHPLEAKLILAIKDQNISNLYPNITNNLVFEAGFITEAVSEYFAKNTVSAPILPTIDIKDTLTVEDVPLKVTLTDKIKTTVKKITKPAEKKVAVKTKKVQAGKNL